MVKVFKKDPNENLDYDIDFSRWVPDGDAIASAIAIVGGGTAVVGTVTPSNEAVKIWVSGGITGETNIVTVRATTTAGRIKELAVRIKIKETA